MPGISLCSWECSHLDKDVKLVSGKPASGARDLWTRDPMERKRCAFPTLEPNTQQPQTHKSEPSWIHPEGCLIPAWARYISWLCLGFTSNLGVDSLRPESQNVLIPLSCRARRPGQERHVEIEAEAPFWKMEFQEPLERAQMPDR